MILDLDQMYVSGNGFGFELTPKNLGQIIKLLGSNLRATFYVVCGNERAVIGYHEAVDWVRSAM